MGVGWVCVVPKRVLEYGVRAPIFAEVSGSKREKTAFHENLQVVCFVLTEISGNLREFTGECNLGILYSRSLLANQPIAEDISPSFSRLRLVGGAGLSVRKGG